jgi:hypothetical protein
VALERGSDAAQDASAQIPQTRTRGGGSLRRDVLVQCHKCGSQTTARMRGSELEFGDGVSTVERELEHRWRIAEADARRTNDHRNADMLLRHLRDARNKPAQVVHRGCGGTFKAFDIGGAS